MEGGVGVRHWRLRPGPARLPGRPAAYLVFQQDDELRAQDQALEPSGLHERRRICRGPGAHPAVWAASRQHRDSCGLQPGSQGMPAAHGH